MQRLERIERTWTDMKGHATTWKDMQRLERTCNDLKGREMKWIEIHSRIIIATGCCILKQIPVSCRWRKPPHPGAFGTQSSAHVRSSEFGIWEIPYDFCLEGPGKLRPTVGCLVGCCFSCRSWQMEMWSGAVAVGVFVDIIWIYPSSPSRMTRVTCLHFCPASASPNQGHLHVWLESGGC